MRNHNDTSYNYIINANVSKINNNSLECEQYTCNRTR
nr:MAG TPA: hypothetical protein [Caudoviricetes sp.]